MWVDIEFHDWTKLKKIKGIVHQLKWDPNGKWKVIQVPIDDIPIPGLRMNEK